MWSYRLYRYPSPAAGLVHGVSESLSDNSSMVADISCPQAVAEAVYRALLSGTKLPPLTHSQELRAALLTFQPSSTFSETQEADLANRNQTDGRSVENAPVSSILPPKAKTPPPPPPTQPQPQSQAAEKSKKKSPASSVLMIEALSRRRMDAVRQLHEVCPQLLASIPLFDHRPVPPPALSPDTRPSTSGFSSHNYGGSGGGGIPLNCSPSSLAPHSVSASSSFSLTPNVCRLNRSSHLLDLAAENQTLLVFVLQHHPEIGGRSGKREASSPSSPAAARGGHRVSRKSDAEDGGVNSARDSCQYSADTPQAPQTPPPAKDCAAAAKRRHGVTSQDEVQGHPGGSGGLASGSGHEEEEKNGGEDEPLADLDPNNPVTICIRKNDSEVLQYLLFKHVWQHFLLDEAFNKPHTSYNSDAILEDLLGGCPDCLWFVHCAALMGCPQLLQMVLCGQFCQHPLKRTFLSGSIPQDSGTFSLLKGDGGKSAQSKTLTLSKQPEAGENQRGKKSARIADGSKIVEVQESLVGTVAENSDREMDNECCSHEKSVLQASTQSASSKTSKTIPPSSAQGGASPESQTRESKSPSPSPRPRQTSFDVPEKFSTPCPLSRSGSQTRPDPNKAFPVSLPIMDRWISRCMHVKLTPLHLACWRCDPDSIKVLLHHGADVGAIAEELAAPDSHRADTPGSQATDPASAESSTLEMSLNFMSVTVNSSGLDLGTRHNSLEELLKKGATDKPCGLSALAMLALGIRSPPDFSLSIGKSLGLVLPTLPELWGGQVDRTSWRAKQSLLEALHLLLDAGCDVNVSSRVFGKTYRAMELFLEPSVDLYYAPLMPRGGRDSAVLRCMDLEHVADLVLHACWEMCARGGRLGPAFASSMEWNLFRMDWAFLKTESLQNRFMHLAVFLGLFPPLDPDFYVGSGAAGVSSSRRGRGGGGGGGSCPSSDESQSSVGVSFGVVDLQDSHLPPYSSPLRPSCVPWAHTGSVGSASSPQSPVDSDVGIVSETVAPPVALPPLEVGGEVVASYYSHAATQVSGTRQPPYGTFAPAPPDTAPQSASRGQHDVSAGFYPGNHSSSTPCLPDSCTRTKEGEGEASSSSKPGPGTSPAMKAQIVRWSLEERQRRCLSKFVNEAVRLALPPSCLALLLRFLCQADLNLLARITQHTLHTSASAMETPLQRLHDAVRQAQLTTLQHRCKQAILTTLGLRPRAVHALPLPDCLKRYLLDPS